MGMSNLYDRLSKYDLAQFGFDADHSKSIRGGREWHCPCPNCGDKDDLVVSNGLYWCRECGWSGKLENLLKEPPSPEEAERLRNEAALRRAREEAREREERKTKIATLNRSPFIYRVFHENLLKQPDVLNMLKQDGIGLEMVKHFQVGFIPNFRYWIDKVAYQGPGITFPFFDASMCIQISVRLLDERAQDDKYRPFLTGMGMLFFDARIFEKRWIVIVEGEKKAIVLHAHGIPAVGIRGNYGFAEEWVVPFQRAFANIFIALDPDKAGQAGSERIKGLFKGKATVVSLEGKPDDLLVQGKLTSKDLIALFVKLLYEGK